MDPSQHTYGSVGRAKLIHPYKIRHLPPLPLPPITYTDLSPQDSPPQYHVTDMKVRTISLAHGQVIKATIDSLRSISLAQGRVIKATFEYMKKHNYTCLGQVLPRNCITRPWASDIVKRKLVTKVSKGQEVAQGQNNSCPGVGVNG